MKPWTAEDSMSIPGFIEPDELEWLHSQAKRFASIVEIGTWKGRSALALATGCNGKFWTVDHFTGSPSEREAAHVEALVHDIGAEAKDNLAGTGAEILTMSSLQASRLFQENSVDMVFIDGEHTRESVLIDLIAWRPKVKVMLCGHDRGWDGVQEALSIYGIPYECGPGSLWWMETIA